MLTVLFLVEGPHLGKEGADLRVPLYGIGLELAPEFRADL